MIGAIFEADEDQWPSTVQSGLTGEDLGNAVSDATSAEEEVQTSGEVDSFASDAKPQPDEDDADIAFVGDRLPAEDEETVEDFEAAPANDTPDAGEKPPATVADLQGTLAPGLFGADEFAFHPEGSEDRQASEPETESTEETVTFAWVCECEEPEEDAGSGWAEGGYGDEPSFVVQDSGDALL